MGVVFKVGVGMGVYVVVKVGVVWFIEVLVVELFDCGVIVNVLLLSIIDMLLNCKDMFDVDFLCWVWFE